MVFALALQGWEQRQVRLGYNTLQPCWIIVWLFLRVDLNSVWLAYSLYKGLYVA